MGIKFFCPNGHKLNVKSFLGGKRAICPKCGARVLVPHESQTQSAVGEESSSAAQSTAEIALASSTSGLDYPAAGSVALPPPSAPAAPPDPIAEAPSAVWYVRPGTGGQYGPASGEVMRSWLNEGRVGAASLVWRNGWPEWRVASTVFAELSGAADAPGVAAPVPAEAAASVASGSLPGGQVVQNIGAASSDGTPRPLSTAMPPLAQAVRKRRRQNDKRLIASIVLIVLTVMLAIVLILVFRRQNAAPESPAQDKSPPAEVSKE